jgi:hypothetical protein
MRLSPALAVAATLSAAQAHADPAADYDRLRTVLPTLLFGRDTAQHLEQTAGMLEQMNGRWVMVSAAFPDGVTFPDASLIARMCDKQAFDLATDGTYGVTLTMPTDTAPHVIRLRYAGYSTFLATFDEAGVLARFLPGNTASEVGPEVTYNLVTNGALSGYVSLYPVGPDLILLHPLLQPPELLARCP